MRRHHVQHWPLLSAVVVSTLLIPVSSHYDADAQSIRTHTLYIYTSYICSTLHALVHADTHGRHSRFTRLRTCHQLRTHQSTPLSGALYHCVGM